MDSFWSKLLILGIVAAIGMFFIVNVYSPQKAAQEAMADSTQQTVNAVRLGVESTSALTVNSQEVINTVTTYCKPGNTINIVVEKTGGTTYTYTTAIYASVTGEDINTIVDSSKQYAKQESSGEIRFIEQ